MSPIEVRDLGEPEAVVSYPLGTANQVHLAHTVVTRHVLQPGWSWEEHAQPLVGTDSCELFHRGVVLSGRMGVRTDEGEELVIGPNQVFDLPPGHVTWVEGDEELVMVDWAGGAGFGTQPGEGSRALVSIVFTDIVDSTTLARNAGDASWKRAVAMHDDVVRSVLAGFGGREIETAATRSWSSSTAQRALSAAGWPSSQPLMRSGSRSASASIAARWSWPTIRFEAWQCTPRRASWTRPNPAKSSCRARPATLPKAPPGSRSSLEADTVSKAWSENTSCSPRRPQPRPEEPRVKSTLRDRARTRRVS